MRAKGFKKKKSFDRARPRLPRGKSIAAIV